MSLNLFMEPLPTFNYAQHELNADLLRGVNIHMIRMRLAGNITIAGGTTSGTIVPNAPATLIESIRIVWDGIDLVQAISGEDLLRITRRCVTQSPEYVIPANGDAQTGTPFSCELILPFVRPWLANPYDTVLPALPVANQFRVFVRFRTGVTVGASDRGSSAIIRGGDRIVTFSTPPTLTAILEYSDKPFNPWYIPIISVRTGDAFAAAQTALPMRILGNLRFDSVHLFSEDGADRDPANIINSIALTAGTRRYWNAISREILKNKERNQFPAALSSTAEPGSIFVLFADGGKLSNVINPNALRAMGSDPRFEFNMATPVAPGGITRAVMFELMTREGITQIQDAGGD